MMWSRYNPKYRLYKERFYAFLADKFTIALVAFIIGLIYYFTYQPSVYIASGVIIFSLIIWIIKRKALFFSWLACVFFWFSLAQICAYGRQEFCQHTILQTPIYQTRISGQIQSVLHLPHQQIIIIDSIKPTFFQASFPEKIQLVHPNETPALIPHQQIQAQISVFPPHQNTFLNTPMSRRALWYQKIGAVGVIHQIITQQDTPQSGYSIIQKIRQNIIQHLWHVMDENPARIAIALTTGEQKFILPEQYQQYRQAGITHVLSVSGFHMALLAGFLFFIIRGLCCLYPKLTLYHNSKKIAAVLAWLGTAFYLILSNMQIPAIRSFGMISLVFLGILTDRPAFSKHSLFLIAFALLLWAPENVLSISFQLSFLAVLILITTHEWATKHWAQKSKKQRHFYEFILMNFTIGLGLMPLVAWHFNLINPYGIFANMIFSGLFSFVLMPLLFIGILLIPITGGHIMFGLANKALIYLDHMTQTISNWPLSEIPIASYPSLYITLIVFGLIFMCLYRNKILAGLCFIVAIVGICTTTQPTMIIAHKGQTIAYVQKNTLYYTGNSDFIVQQWATKLGLSKLQQISLPKRMMFGENSIAFTAYSCVGSDFAILPHSDSRCRMPTLIPQENKIYFLSLSHGQIKIQELE